MTQITLLQNLIANVDLYLPRLLPALEAIELTVPSTVRLLICVLLTVWLAVLKQRHAAAAASRFHQVVLHHATRNQLTEALPVFQLHGQKEKVPDPSLSRIL